MLFKWFTKKKDEIPNLAPDIAKLEGSVSGLATSSEKTNGLIQKQNEQFAAFVSKLEAHFKNIENTANTTSGWMKEFNRLIMNDYVSGPRKRVYSFLYSYPRTGDRRMIMVARDKFEEAHATSAEVLSGQGLNMREWMLEQFQSIDVPTEGSPEAIKKLDELTQASRPIESYIHCLELAKERFCETPTEKKTVDGLIRKINKTYASRN